MYWNVTSEAMRINHTAARERNLAMLGARSAGSRVATALIWLSCLVINAIPLATTASAHVKWFVTCEASDEPLPVHAVLTPTFWLISALFVTVFYIGCKFERTKLGVSLSTLLDRLSEPLHTRADCLVRGAAAVSFALLWADGEAILTPELKGSGVWLSAIQVLIPIYLFGRATLPAAAAGIVVLYGYGVATYGLFHMLDYPVFLGLAAYLTLSTSQSPKLNAFGFDCLRWTVALSLLWPSMEKFVYPGWIAPLAATHPELTLGVDVSTFITAAGVVEFGLSFALLWTPLVRRFGALGLALLLFGATFDFGKMDGIGHLMIIIILLVVFADPGRKQVHCRPASAPIVAGATLLAVIFLYTGGHTLYYGASRAAVVPLVSAAALLMVVVLYLHGIAHCILRTIAHLWWVLSTGVQWNPRYDIRNTQARRRSQRYATSRPVPGPRRATAMRANG